MMRSLATLAFLSLLSSCAPDVFRADAGAMIVQTRGDIALQNSAGTLILNGNMNDLEDHLGVGDTEVAPFLRLEADWGRHRGKVNLFGYEESGQGNLGGGDYGNIPTGTPVSTKLDFFSTAAAWSYDLLEEKTWRFAPGIQLGYYALDVGATSTAPVAFEEVEARVFVPEIYIEGAADLGLIELNASLGLMAADLGDADGRYVDLEAGVILRPAKEFEVIAGWRYIVVDAHGQATSRDFDSDVYINGFFLGGGVRF